MCPQQVGVPAIMNVRGQCPQWQSYAEHVRSPRSMYNVLQQQETTITQPMKGNYRKVSMCKTPTWLVLMPADTH